MGDGFPPPVARTIEWLRDRFGTYYRRHPPAMPDRFTRREFGFILWPDRPGPPPFVRHRAYTDKHLLHDFLARRAPHSVYYSTAYYRRPGELKMADKQWLGAELIFDLDADHLDEAEAAKAAGSTLSIAEQLTLVKQQFQRLLDEFLFGDFGLDPRHVWITFSGGRGYHAHVTEPSLLQLDAKGRREIVDYVTGKFPAKKGSDEPDLSGILHEKAVRVGGDRSGKVQKMLVGAPADAPGWPGRLTRTLAETLEAHVLDAPREEAVAWLSGFQGIGPKSAETFVAKFNDKKMDLIRKGKLGLDDGGVYRKVVQRLLTQSSLALSKGETDEPVTADVKRLIRLPDSLHGKSGLRVVRLTRDLLDDFDPFRDAVAFSMDPVRFTARNDDTVTLGGETVTVHAGEATEVPEAHAVWWCARQNGTITVP